MLRDIIMFVINFAWVFAFAMALMKFPTWKHDAPKVIFAILIGLFAGYVSIGGSESDHECREDYKGHCM